MNDIRNFYKVQASKTSDSKSKVPPKPPTPKRNLSQEQPKVERKSAVSKEKPSKVTNTEVKVV